MTIKSWVASYMKQTNSVQHNALAMARGKTSQKNCNARAALRIVNSWKIGQHLSRLFGPLDENLPMTCKLMTKKYGMVIFISTT
jgi:hypothetical protein